MPTYVYESVLPDGQSGPPGEVFEVTQRMSEPALTQHPETGQPVRRVIQAPHLGGVWSESSQRAMMSDRKLAEQGFTKYVKTDTGSYEKTTGEGPRKLSA